MYAKEHQVVKELENIVKEQLNVKKIELKTNHPQEEIKIEFDANLTTELESEGYARELSRVVQDFRKKLGLNKNDLIELQISTDESLKKILESQEKFIEERTNAKKLFINPSNVTTDKERFKNRIDFKIKDKRGEIAIVIAK